MPIEVVCAGCDATFQVKDEFAGRKVRCSECKEVIVVPDTVEAEEFIDDENLDLVFQRDKFLLHQKHFSINTRYAVCSEAGNEIMHVVRPTHFFKSLLAMFVIIFELVVLIGVSIAIGVVLSNSIGEVATGIIIVLGIVLAAAAALYTYALLAPKRHITFYRDAEYTQKLLEVLQDQKLALRMMRYTVRDADGKELGRFRKDYLANFLRKKWDGFDAEGNHQFVIREDSIILSLLRRFLGTFYGLLRTNFVIHRVDESGKDGALVGEFNRKFTLLDRYVLDCSHDRGRAMDRRMAIAIGVLLDTAESR